MAEVRSFLDNLKNLRLVTSVALEHVQENHGKFVKEATEGQLHQFERYIAHIRTLTRQLEKEFNTVEYLVAKRLRNSSARH